MVYWNGHVGEIVPHLNNRVIRIEFDIDIRAGASECWWQNGTTVLCHIGQGTIINLLNECKCGDVGLRNKPVQFILSYLEVIVFANCVALHVESCEIDYNFEVGWSCNVLRTICKRSVGIRVIGAS